MTLINNNLNEVSRSNHADSDHCGDFNLLITYELSETITAELSSEGWAKLSETSLCTIRNSIEASYELGDSFEASFSLKGYDSIYSLLSYIGYWNNGKPDGNTSCQPNIETRFNLNKQDNGELSLNQINAENFCTLGFYKTNFPEYLVHLYLDDQNKRLVSYLYW